MWAIGNGGKLFRIPASISLTALFLAGCNMPGGRESSKVVPGLRATTNEGPDWLRRVWESAVNPTAENDGYYAARVLGDIDSPLISKWTVAKEKEILAATPNYFFTILSQKSDALAVDRIFSLASSADHEVRSMAMSTLASLHIPRKRRLEFFRDRLKRSSNQDKVEIASYLRIFGARELVPDLEHYAKDPSISSFERKGLTDEARRLRLLVWHEHSPLNYPYPGK